MADSVKDATVDALSRAVNRRKTAMQKLKKGEKPGTIGERRLRKLLKQAQRRKRKALVDQARRAKPKGEEAAAATA
jgi:hypothetical protein